MQSGAQGVQQNQLSGQPGTGPVNQGPSGVASAEAALNHALAGAQAALQGLQAALSGNGSWQAAGTCRTA